MAFQIIRLQKPKNVIGEVWHVSIVGKDLDPPSEKLNEALIVHAENKAHAKCKLKKEIKRIAKLAFHTSGYHVRVSASLCQEF